MTGASTDYGSYHPIRTSQVARGVEAYRPVDAEGYAMLHTATQGIAQAVAKKPGTNFVPIQEEHARHMHIISTYDFGVGRQLLPVEPGVLRQPEAELSSDMPAETASQRLVVYIAGLVFHHSESSLAFSYALGGRELARESFCAVQLCGSAVFTQPSITAGELQSPSTSIGPQQIEDAVILTLKTQYMGLIDKSVGLGPLAVQPF